MNYVFTCYSTVESPSQNGISNPGRISNNFRNIRKDHKVLHKPRFSEGEYKSLAYKLVSIARVITGCENSITVSRRERTGHVRRGLTRADRFWSTSQSSVVARGNPERNAAPFLDR